MHLYTADVNGIYLVRLAKQTAESVIRKQNLPIIPDVIPPIARLQRACYVSIFDKPGRRLRVMHGYPFPRFQTLVDEVVSNTAEAVQMRDVRFSSSDLSHLSFTVAVLGAMERITSHLHLDPDRYGVYVKTDRGKSAILLSRRTGIESAEDQLATAFREARVDTDTESVALYRFFVEYFS